MFDSLQPHGLQHARLPCPSLTPGVCSNSCLLSHWCHITSAILFSFLASVFPSIRVFSKWVSSLHHVAKVWSLSFSISSSNEYSGLISFRIDWFHLFAVQGTLKSLLQHYSLKASILQCSVFFMVQLSHRNMTTGKTIALTIWTFSLTTHGPLEMGMANHPSISALRTPWTVGKGKKTVLGKD